MLNWVLKELVLWIRQGKQKEETANSTGRQLEWWMLLRYPQVQSQTCVKVPTCRNDSETTDEPGVHKSGELPGETTPTEPASFSHES